MSWHYFSKMVILPLVSPSSFHPVEAASTAVSPVLRGSPSVPRCRPAATIAEARSSTVAIPFRGAELTHTNRGPALGPSAGRMPRATATIARMPELLPCSPACLAPWRAHPQEPHADTVLARSSHNRARLPATRVAWRGEGRTAAAAAAAALPCRAAPRSLRSAPRRRASGVSLRPRQRADRAAAHLACYLQLWTSFEAHGAVLTRAPPMVVKAVGSSGCRGRRGGPPGWQGR